MIYSLRTLREIVDLKGIPKGKFEREINNHSFEVESLTSDILDVDVAKTNRIDANSYFGFAAELSSVFGRRLKISLKESMPDLADSGIRLQLDTTICPVFTLSAYEGVRVGRSPEWLRSTLKASGIKAINNVVDITNYTMLITGQPMHAYDADKIAGDTIVARKANKGEVIRTLDGETHVLNRGDIVIADESGVIGVGGVMGGESTMVARDTKNVLLEAANFNPLSVRRSSWNHNLRTDSANRFEKGLSVQFTSIAQAFALDLMKDLAEAKCTGFTKAGTAYKTSPKITLDSKYPGQLLGFEIRQAEIEKILQKIGTKFSKQGGKYIVTVPFWRQDLRVAEDLVEEIGRLLGLDKIPETAPVVRSDVKTDLVVILRDSLRKVITGLGFDEVYNYSFSQPKTTHDLGFKHKDHLQILNPLSGDQEILRKSLLPNLSMTAKKNLRFQNEVSVFEFGNVYLKKPTLHFHDAPRLAFAYTTQKGSDKDSFKELKGRVTALLESLNLTVDYRRFKINLNFQGTLKIFTSPGGELGMIALDRTGKRAVALCELDMDALQEVSPVETQFAKFSVYPKQVMDLTIEVDRSKNWSEIKDIILEEDLVTKLQFLNSYQGREIGKGKKSLSARLSFQAMDKTLTDREAKVAYDRIINKLKKKFKAKIR